MSRQTRMVEIIAAQPRGTLIVLYAGTFTEAKHWGRQHFNDGPVMYREPRWKNPLDVAFEFEKSTGKPLLSQPSGPVAFKFVKEPKHVSA